MRISSFFLTVCLANSAFAQSTADSRIPASATSNKLTVCGVTINSNDEIEEFKKGLGDRAEFVELTTLKSETVDLDAPETENKEKEEEDWFRFACKRKVQCDVLVVSGHFGGTFFGSSGLNLHSEALERNSCDATCDGILQRPKEVFLFGCNTLAGKTRDRRTPEEYRRVLIQDGFEPERADEVVAFRYSPIGATFNDQMRRVFRGAKRIYGFDSIAPSGKNVKGLLRNYLAQVKNTNYYSKESFAKLSENINQPLKEALKSTALVQVAGVNNMAREQIPMCYLENPKVARIDKLNWIEKSLKGDSAFAFLPTINEYLKNLDSSSWSDLEKSMVQKIGQNQKLRDSITSIVKTRDSAILSMQMKLLSFMKFFSWIAERDYTKEIERLLIGDLNTDFSVEHADQICSSIASLGVAVRVSPASVPEARWSDVEFLKAFSCMSSFSEAGFQKLMAVYKNSANSSALEKAALSAISSLKVEDEAAPVFYKAIFPNGEQPVDAKLKKLLCEAHHPMLPIKTLNVKYASDPKYIETVGCYGKPSSSLVTSLIEASKQRALKGAAAAALGRMYNSGKIALSVDSQLQMLTLIQENRNLSGILEQVNELAPIVRDKILSILNSSTAKSEDGEVFEFEWTATKILSKQIYCPNAIDRVNRALQSKQTDRALSVFDLFANACINALGESSHLTPGFVKLSAPSLSKLISEIAKLSDDDLEPMWSKGSAETIILAVDLVPLFTSIEQVYGLMRLNEGTVMGRSGNPSSDEQIISKANAATLKPQIIRAFTSGDNGQRKIALRFLEHLDVEDKKIDEALVRLVEAEPVTQQKESHFPALLRQDAKAAVLLWLGKFSKVSDAQLDKIAHLDVIYGAQSKFFEMLPAELEAKRIDPAVAARALVVAYQHGDIEDDFAAHKQKLRELKAKISLPVIQQAIIKAATALRRSEVQCEENPRICR